MKLQNKSSKYRKLGVVTGASSGIGLELSKLMAEDGHDLILVARDKSNLQRLARELEFKYNIEVIVIAGDLTKSVNIDRVVRAAMGRPVDVLINSAGLGSYGLFTDSSWEVDEAMMMLNIVSLTNLTKKFLPGMLSRHKGYILNLASLASFMPGPYMSVYFATKSYVLSLSRAISSELSGTGVSVTALCPGPTASGFKQSAKVDSRLFQGNLPSAASVARYGYQAMKARKVVAIPRFSNRLVVLAISFIPSSLVSKYLIRVLRSTN